MILDKNNSNNSFINNFKKNNPNESTKIRQDTNTNKNKKFGLNEGISTYKYTNPTNEIEMYDKSIAMLHERLNNNLITIDEFNKKCRQIGKKKEQALKKQNKF